MTSIQRLYSYFLSSSGITSDSRIDTTNKMFFALRGENFNGNIYAKAAIEGGAIFAIIDDLEYELDDRYIVVQDVLHTLQQLATYHRNQLEATVMCVTGSNGKTTTKELIRSVLQSKYKVHATEGNYNNLIGMPLTILSAPIDTNFLLLEIGSNSPGEIKALVEIAQPTAGIVTNIGAAHLEGFGSIEGVLKEKTALYEYLRTVDGLMIVPEDDPLLWSYAKAFSDVYYYFETDLLKHTEKHFGVHIKACVPSISGKFMDFNNVVYDFESTLAGAHNCPNISAAIAVAKIFEVPPVDIVKGIGAYSPKDNRSQIIKWKNTMIILDAYNANPTSMERALKMLSDWPLVKKAVILGDMLEVGSETNEAHSNIITIVEDMGIDQAFYIGEIFSSMKDIDEKTFPNIKALMENHPRLFENELSKSVVLIKGSRGNKLERVLDLIELD